MNQTTTIKILLSLALVFTAFGCGDKGPGVPKGDYEAGMFILNEGGFGNGNASVTYQNPEDGSLQQGLFDWVNERPLGDVLQSFTQYGATAYLVVNNSKKVEVIDAGSWESMGTIQGFGGPRYLIVVTETKLYVSDWVNDVVAVVNPGNFSISSTIKVGTGPEQILLYSDKAFVANSGGFGVDSTVSVIDVLTDEVEATFEVGKAPIQMVLDANSKIWLLCRGDYGDFGDLTDDIGGQLIRINPMTNAIEATFDFSQTSHPGWLRKNADGTTIYFENGFVYEMDVNATALPTAPLLNNYFYGMNVDPETGDLYACDPGDYTSAGTVYQYSSAGVLLDSITSGIVPNGVAFQ